MYSIYQKWQKFPQTKIPYTVWSDSNNLIKLVLKNFLTSIEDFESTKKELELSFSQKQVYNIKNSVIKKRLFSYNATYFFSQILIGFACSLIPVGFRAILISCLSFVSQKTYPWEFLREELILSRSYVVLGHPLYHHQFFIFKKCYKLWTARSERLILSGFSYLYDTYYR